MTSANDADLSVIIPTRSRPWTIQSIAKAFDQTCTANTWIVFYVDGCPQLDAYQQEARKAQSIYPRMFLLSGPRRRLVGALNHHAVLMATAEHPPFAIGFMGDDHRPLTHGWDTRYVQALQEMGSGIVYGDDELQGENMPTQVAMTSDIICTLGFMAPPALQHLYCDNFWLDLGRSADCIRYLPDVVVRHNHPDVGRSPRDASYAESNSAAQYAHDSAAYREFCQVRLDIEVQKVRSLRDSRIS